MDPIPTTWEQRALSKKHLALEYGQMAKQPNLSQSDQDRMGEILDMAENDASLEFWMQQVDFLVDEAGDDSNSPGCR